MAKRNIIVLDYSDASIHKFYDIDLVYVDDPDDLYEVLNKMYKTSFKANQCEWMQFVREDVHING